MLAAVQPIGNFAASAIAGTLWTTASPGVGFMFLAAAMSAAVAVLAVGAAPASRRAPA